jgi:hypothetical protein
VQPTFGGVLRLTKDPHTVHVDAFQPGNAFIDASNGTSSQLITVEVRAGKLTPPPGFQPPTKVHPKSNGFISADDSEPCFTSNRGGRPIDPKAGGRKINLGGEFETPGFEDYSADLDFCGFPNRKDGNKMIFRPWSEDPDPAVAIKAGEAGNICIRGTPITDIIIAAIRRIAGAGCRLTFSGSKNDVAVLKNAFPGGKIIDELPSPDDAVVMELS